MKISRARIPSALMISLLVSLSASGCGGGSTPTEASGPSASGPATQNVPDGTWGGTGVRMILSGASGSIEFDCAHAVLPAPIPVDASGALQLVAPLVMEGGPTPANPPSDGRPVTFSGKLSGQTLHLQMVEKGSGNALGKYVLQLGASGILHKCQ